MNTFYDVQELLKSFNIIIYMKDRKYMLQLVEFEIRELYRLKLINQDSFLRAISILKSEFKLI
ncbi:YqgQ family protein [Gemelliphila palaticanis]|uniref:YqgQ family protein n=1 Tax=Gemelliphila palaticanis TaxID=81950 RepID=A0ABX2SY40_9BACL|nr:YqgQ family protein [Gemella palaticanis]MBF0715223.1 YqgQ family protein [Gemella palaticanis]NYS47153.1 YqgQ family protein [Gemella palaticanis]